jgi:hypothetical protein
MSSSTFSRALRAALTLFVLIGSTVAVAPAHAAVHLKSTDDYLRGSFVGGEYLEGFTPGKPDFGFTLEAMIQRRGLGESLASLAPAVKFALENAAVTGTNSKPVGYLFDAAGKPKLGMAGKFAYASALLNAKNLKVRTAVLNVLRSKIDGTGDFATDTNANTYDRAWVVLGLAANGSIKQAATLAARMVGHQLKSGGFNDGYDLGVGSPDGTGIVLQALASVKQSGTNGQGRLFAKSIKRAVAYLRGSAIGGNHFESYGDANVNGTAYALMGLTAVSVRSGTMQAWLKQQLATDGGIATPWSGGSGDVYATAQGAIALVGLDYGTLIASGKMGGKQ